MSCEKQANPAAGGGCEDGATIAMVVEYGELTRTTGFAPVASGGRRTEWNASLDFAWAGGHASKPPQADN